MDARTYLYTKPHYSGVYIHPNEFRPRIKGTLTLRRSQTMVRKSCLSTATNAAETELLEHETGPFGYCGLTAA